MSTNVFLINSIRNKSFSNAAINTIVTTLQKKHINIIHQHVTNFNQENIDNLSSESNIAFHKTILKDIRLSDVVVSECSTESLSVGFLLSYAYENEKPIIIFIKVGCSKPNIFRTLGENSKIYIVEYSNLEDLSELLVDYLELALDKTESRFNFYLPPSISNYLKWISKKHNKSKSAFVRDMLQEMMSKDFEYLN